MCYEHYYTMYNVLRAMYDVQCVLCNKNEGIMGFIEKNDVEN